MEFVLIALAIAVLILTATTAKHWADNRALRAELEDARNELRHWRTIEELTKADLRYQSNIKALGQACEDVRRAYGSLEPQIKQLGKSLPN